MSTRVPLNILQTILEILDEQDEHEKKIILYETDSTVS